MLNKAKELDAKEVKQNIEEKIAKIKLELEDLDKEKVLAIAKKKAKQIEKKAKALADYAVKKGTPVLQDMTNSIRESAIKVTKEVLKKLEKEQ